jgi:hypothetical protein
MDFVKTILEKRKGKKDESCESKRWGEGRFR